TARLAAELGRAVFAVPGPVTSRQSTGTNRLLCDGAIPAVDGTQVLAELGFAASSLPQRPANLQAVSRVTSLPANRQPGVQAMEPLADKAESDTPSGAPEIDPQAMLVREALPTARSGRGAEVLTLAAATGLAPSEVLALLGRLAAVGEAVKTGG